MGVKTVKGIEDSAWRQLKVLATVEEKSMGNMLNKVIKEYCKEGDRFWDEILNGKKTLTDKEADEIMKDINKMRKEYGWRI